MEKKLYIKPSAKAYMVTPVQIISTSEQSFSSGGSADPYTSGRAKKRFFDTVGDSDDE